MQFINHLQLGRALAAESPVLAEHLLRRELFLLGSMIPDFIPFTYLSGYRETHRWLGHSLPHSTPKIERNLKKRLSVGLRSAKDAFRLGVLLHYLADSFTYVHSAGFAGGRREHDRYERELRKVFPQFLHLVRETDPAHDPAFLAEARWAYQSLPPSAETDSEWIVRVCSAVFFAVGSV